MLTERFAAADGAARRRRGPTPAAPARWRGRRPAPLRAAARARRAHRPRARWCRPSRICWRRPDVGSHADGPGGHRKDPPGDPRRAHAQRAAFEGNVFYVALAGVRAARTCCPPIQSTLEIPLPPDGGDPEKLLVGSPAPPPRAARARQLRAGARRRAAPSAASLAAARASSPRHVARVAARAGRARATGAAARRSMPSTRARAVPLHGPVRAARPGDAPGLPHRRREPRRGRRDLPPPRRPPPGRRAGRRADARAVSAGDVAAPRSIAVLAHEPAARPARAPADAARRALLELRPAAPRRAGLLPTPGRRSRAASPRRRPPRSPRTPASTRWTA